jgi:MtN3 and saliva related transmembrane protein
LGSLQSFHESELARCPFAAMLADTEVRLVKEQHSDPHAVKLRRLAMNRFRQVVVFTLPSLIVLCGCQNLTKDTHSLLFSGFERSEIMGILAGFGTTFAGVPDLLAMLRRRSTAGMNPRMAAIMCIFQILWAYYGLLIVSRPVVLWNLIGVLVNALNVGAYFYFLRKENASSTHAAGGK